jgi:DNA excision repair protein ERCC-2
LFLRLDDDLRTVRAPVTGFLEKVMLPSTLAAPAPEIDLAARQRAHREFQESVGGEIEVPVTLEESFGGFRFLLAGRADIVESTADGLRLTEIKTTARGRPPTLMDADPSWLMQTYSYARAMKAAGAAGLSARLVLVPCRGGFDPLEIPVDPDDQGMESQWLDLLSEASRHLTRAVARHRGQVAALEDPVFPWESRRPGQDLLERISARTVGSGTWSLVEAPTGTGKTAAVLAGALSEALPRRMRVFFLTSKNTQRLTAVSTVGAMAGRGLPVSSIVIEARAAICASCHTRCKPLECTFSRVFGPRVRSGGLLHELLSGWVVLPDRVRELAARHGVCPYELQLAASEHCDIVICDCNYAFDPSVHLRRFFDDPSTAVDNVLLVDEAANLPSRARDYYSPQISAAMVDAAASSLKGFRRFGKLVAELAGAFEELALVPLENGEEETDPSVLSCLRPEAWAREVLQTEKTLPDPIFDLFMAVVGMSRIAGLADGRFHLLLRRDSGRPVLQWFCKDASEFTGETFRSCASAVCFSATLRPLDHHRELLGLGPETRTASLPWPFPRENLRVWVDPGVDTRFRLRQASLPELAGRITRLVSMRPGTYLVFFPSYEYLAMAAPQLSDAGPPVLVQRPGMTAHERAEFLAALAGCDHLVLTVAGGIFAEGVDLVAPARRGAIVVGPCLPAPDLRQSLLSGYYEDRGLGGFVTASAMPGISRVVQAAGRLVRSPSDRGVIVLMDRRFGWHPFVDLLPEHWLEDGRPRMLGSEMGEIEAFWGGDRE